MSEAVVVTAESVRRSMTLQVLVTGAGLWL